MYVSRRNFLKSASVATLSALAAGEPRLWGGETKPDTAESHRPIRSFCSGWPAAWRRRKRSIRKQYQPFEVGLAGRESDEHIPGHRYGGRQHQDLRRAGEHRQSDGSGHARSVRTCCPTWGTFSTRGINIIGTPVTCRRKPWRRRISERGLPKCWGRRIRRFRRSSISASNWRTTARRKS